MVRGRLPCPDVLHLARVHLPSLARRNRRSLQRRHPRDSRSYFHQHRKRFAELQVSKFKFFYFIFGYISSSITTVPAGNRSHDFLYVSPLP